MQGIQKIRYEKAQAEVLLFDNSDIITTSGNAGENSGCQGSGWENYTGYNPGGLCVSSWGGSGNDPQG